MFTKRELAPDQIEYIARVRSRLSAAPQHVRDRAAFYATTLMENGFPVLFDVGHLAHVVGVSPQVVGYIAARPARFYSDFRIPKRTGGSRLISAPVPTLKRIQSWIHNEITSTIEVHPACHGFVRGRSIATNAAPHVRADIIMKLDITDFFGSVQREQVYRVFRRLGYSPGMADVLTDLTTLNGAVPQGAPTSPDLANAAAGEMDFRLATFCRQRTVVYSRYADDLTFSGRAVTSRKTVRTIEHIVRNCGFQPNEKKKRFMSPATRQAVTGIVVNEYVNWPRERRRRLRQDVHFLETYGVDEHLARRGIDTRGYKEHIYGSVYALNAVKPVEAQLLLRKLDDVAWSY